MRRGARMKRREFITVLGGALMGVDSPRCTKRSYPCCLPRRRKKIVCKRIW